jgi:cation diffusion facilitator family transporter
MGVIKTGIRATQTGLLVNATLVIAKFVAGVLGNSYALIADAVESSTDVFSSLVVWGGLHVASLPPDENHPYGHGKAEPLAAAVVALMLIGAALSVAILAIREIMAPHHGTPEMFTLGVLAVVVVVKEVLFRRVAKVGEGIGSIAVQSDAWHHRSDAITSVAAFIGISLAIWGGPHFVAADSWAALVAAIVIATNGFILLRPAVNDLMDRTPETSLVSEIDTAARSVEGVRATEKIRVRKLGMDYYVDIHVQADPTMSLHDAHIISGKVKSAIKAAKPEVQDVLVHMEPVEDGTPSETPAEPGDSENIDRALEEANKEAERFNHEYIGTEHLLLGLLDIEDKLVSVVLTAMKIDPASIRNYVTKLVQQGPKVALKGFKLPITPRARSVIAFAGEEARAGERTAVDAADLLVGLLSEIEGVAAQVLMNYGARLPALREQIAIARGKSTQPGT